jgi:hypothetical protein
VARRPHTADRAAARSPSSQHRHVTEATPPGLPAPARSPSRLRFAFVLLLALAWLVFLVTLAVTTANPVTLNREQLSRADVIVTARIADLAGGRCDVERRWTPGPDLDSIAVANVVQTRARSGILYILPLHSRGDGRFEVVPAHLPDKAPLIYPATPDAFRQLESLLHE